MHHFCTFLVEVRENIKPLFSLLPRSRFAVPPEKLFAHQSSEFDLFFFSGGVNPLVSWIVCLGGFRYFFPCELARGRIFFHPLSSMFFASFS